MIININVHINFLQFENGKLSIEVLDSGDRLIDRFAIDLVDASHIAAGEIHTGLFGVAVIELTLDRVCINNFYGPKCNILCSENCDGCDGVDCDTNQLCVNLVSDYICVHVCMPGFTGIDCSIDIDECTAVNCNNGECIDGNASFTCVCDPRYSGRFCETQLDSYQLMVTIHSFSNPGGMCADDTCVNTRSANFCCERSPCPSTCEYYFSLCQRPSGASISNMRSVNQGNCVETLTGISGSISNGTNFTDSVFGSANPIVLSGVQWVSHV